MTSYSRGHLGRFLTMLPAFAVVCALGTIAAAQDRPVPKWELYGGYSFFYPGTEVNGTLPLGLFPLNSRLEANPRGAGAAVTFNANRWLGFTVDASDNWGQGEKAVQKRIDDAGFSNISAGPKVTFRTAHFSPFLEVLVGDHRLMPAAFHNVNKLGIMTGGGVDLNLSRHIAWRILRADYVASNYNFGPRDTTKGTDVRGVRLQTGLNFMFGGAPALAPGAACSIQPSEVFAGEPVNATASGSNFNPKHTVKYAWSGTGVNVSGSGESTHIDTTGLAPGSYQVAASLSDGSRRGVASCSAHFAVKQSNPPTISCASNPSTIQPGETATISSNASSPDGRPLTYRYTATAGSITGNTVSVTLDSKGAQPGTITVTCDVADDRNPALTASSTATVNVQSPPPPVAAAPTAIEKRLALHSVYFGTAKPTPEHPDGGLLVSQEKTLTTLAGDFKTYLQDNPDAHLTLEGHADPRGSVEYNQALSERRVARIKSYLVEQGLPAASIQAKAFGEQQNLTDAEVKDAVERNPELSAEQRQRVLSNMRTIILASNRRVDITLNRVGEAPQQSVREYPFNAADSLTLLDTTSGKTAHRSAKKRKAVVKKDASPN